MELQTFAQERLARQGGEGTQGRLTKGTISKVVQALDEEKIVLRERGKPRLLSPRLLMGRLQTNYQKPSGRKVQGETLFSVPEVWGQLQQNGLSAVTTGLGSAGRYHVLSGPDMLSLYVKELDATIKLLDVKATSVFPNIELIEYKGDVVYFDAREEKGVLYASPVRTWLELAAGGPREREAAQVLEDSLLKWEGDRLL